MLDMLKMEANRTYTENGAVSNWSTFSECLDLFGTVGGLRHAGEEMILDRFVRAFAEDRDLAVKILFFARAIREGLGERRVFRVILQFLADYAPETVRRNLGYIAEYGRFDDLLALMDTSCEMDALRLIKVQLEADIRALKKRKAEEGKATGKAVNISLLAKWLPSVNTSDKAQCARGKRIAAFCGMRESEYRKVLSALRRELRILENYLRERDYSFDYEKQPSRAMYKYRAAFLRNDGERFEAFLRSVEKGEAKLHADNVYPYELVNPFLGGQFWRGGCGFMKALSEEEKRVLNATWNAMPDFGNGENALAVVDTSGSMYNGMQPQPASVALSLGLYFAEHNRGRFANHFIEFSEHPRLIELKGETFADRLAYAASFSEVANTNIEAVFRLVLDTAVKYRVPREEMPAKLVIISDMEFDCCTEHAELSNFENAKRLYEEAGYALPQLVFWNVASRRKQVPVTMHETGTALVSGCTPRLFSMVAGDLMDPYALMMEILGGERYEKIAA